MTAANEKMVEELDNLPLAPGHSVVSGGCVISRDLQERIRAALLSPSQEGALAGAEDVIARRRFWWGAQTPQTEVSQIIIVELTKAEAAIRALEIVVRPLPAPPVQED